ncbi:MAG TPA: transglycosylase domain-containing protein, partial [Gammaproteobacteria bacterium]|nr:transglycosylase domain-containing protein [Gammaproteobacteria bacterium]
MSRGRRVLGWLLIAVAALGLAAVLALVGVYFYISAGLPSVAVLKDIHLQVPLRVYTRDGKLMAVYGDKLRIPLDYNQIPPLMSEAFIAAEDERFFEHPGLDVRSLSRAGINLIVTGSKSQGASTITMQLARNFFLSPKKLYIRKLREIFLALHIERELSKEDILTLYLNKIYLGNHAYGVGAAAEVYYGRDVWQLDLAQIAMIAGLPQAPSSHNPIVDPQGALARRAYVLGRMRDLGYIDQSAYQRAMTAPLTARRHQARVTVQAPYVGEMVRSYMVNHYGKSAYTAGYRVTTTIDSRLERDARAAVNWNLERLDREHGWRGAVSHVVLPADADAAALNQAIADFHPVENLIPGVVTGTDDQSADLFLGGYG